MAASDLEAETIGGAQKTAPNWQSAEMAAQQTYTMHSARVGQGGPGCQGGLLPVGPGVVSVAGPASLNLVFSKLV